MKRNFTFLLFLLCSFFVKAQDSAIQVPAGNVSLYKSFAIGERSTPGPMLNTVTANSLFSNVTNFTGQVYVNDGATLANGTTNTIMVVDDITMVTNPTYVINQFRFSVANLNTVAVAARPKVRFYAASTGGPATLLAAVDIAPITFTANRISIYNINLTGTTINLGNKTIFAGLTFDDNAGATGITAAQLNLLGQGLFDPADQGSSEDIFFETDDAGSFAASNPVGDFYNFRGNPVANFGWELVSSTPLPVTLTDFNGSKNGKTNLLTWTTAQEINSSQFIIERSNNASTYKEIGSIKAAGNSSNPLSYSFTDALPIEGINYYRLKLVDKDGTYSYSKTVILSSAATSIGIYPNPVTDVVNIYLNNAKLLNTKVNLYDGSGKLVRSVQLTDNQQKIDLKMLSKGLYELTFVDGSVQRFIKQ